MTASSSEARMLCSNLALDELLQSLIKGHLVVLNDLCSDLLGHVGFVRAQAD
jgi:hypothetical protein